MKERESDKMRYEDIVILKSFEQFNGTGTEQADIQEWRMTYNDIVSQLKNARIDNLIKDLTNIYVVFDNYIEDNYIDIELDIIEYNNKSHIIMYNLDNNNLLFLITIEGKDIVVREFDGQYFKNKNIY